MDVYEYTSSVTPTIRIDEIDQMASWKVLDPLPTKVDGGRERAKKREKPQACMREQ